MENDSKQNSGYLQSELDDENNTNLIERDTKKQTKREIKKTESFFYPWRPR
jgi:hypothetical protein